MSINNIARIRIQTVMWLVYPYLLGYYPIIALRNHNIGYVDFFSMIRSILLVSLGISLLIALIYLLLRDLSKSSIIVSIIVLLFLTYGHFYIWLADVVGSPIRHRFLAGVELFFLLFLVFVTLKSERFANLASQFLATVSVVLIVVALVELLFWDIELVRAGTASAPDIQMTHADLGGDMLPDFYLIILDGHTRSDVLRERFDYDNSEFIEQLTELGFYVSSCSQSNYASTKLSLISAFFADYAENLVVDGDVIPPLRSSTLIRTLDSLGYTTITYANRSQGHFDLGEDIFLSRNQLALGKLDLRGGVSEFERMLIDTSFLRFAYETEVIPGFDSDTLTEWEWLEHYYQTYFILDELENIPSIPGPKFVVAHLMVPHPPSIFSPDGTFHIDSNPIRGYRSNVAFIDNRLPPILRTIIDTSDVPPIIVVMGDHGPSTRSTVSKQMRMATLNAYYVNDAAKKLMYPKMTPINAFRIILNTAFDGDYPLLEDDSLYAYKPSELKDADSVVNECIP